MYVFSLLFIIRHRDSDNRYLIVIINKTSAVDIALVRHEDGPNRIEIFCPEQTFKESLQVTEFASNSPTPKRYALE